MRIPFASLAALAVLAIAAPAFGQTESPVSPAPTPVAKPKPGTAAYCNTLKTTASKTACLKRVHAQATPTKAPPPAKTTTKTTKKPPAAAELTPPAQATTPTQSAAAPSAPTPPQTIQVPPLPQKTI